MKRFFTLFAFFAFSSLSAQVFWVEDFNDAGASSRWATENSLGSKTNPTPLGISGLVYETNDACNNYWIINDFNTPENSPAGALPISSTSNYSARFVRGRNYNCLSPNDLPNPDPGGGGTNKSLHVTFKGCSDSYAFGLNNGPEDAADEYSILNIDGPTSPGASNSDQYVFLKNNISTVGQCNIYLEAQMFLGGDQAGAHSYGTVLYSIDGGTTWKILQDHIVPSNFFIAGTCNNWEDRSFLLPPACEGITTLRIAFRWRNNGNQPPINTTADYTLMAGFNVDNIVLKQVGPQAGFNFGSLGSTVLLTQTLCKQQVSTQIVNTTTGTGITGYNWIIPGATFIGGSNVVNPQFYFDEPTAFGSINVTLQVFYGAGCMTSFSRTITLAPCPPYLDFSAKYTTLCATSPVPVAGSVTIDTLINNTSALPSRGAVSYTWTITGPGAVTYVNATSNTSANPQVTFGTVGLYTVQLVASNLDGAGSNSPLIKTNYINVVNCECGNASASGIDIVSYDFNTDNNFLGWTATPTTGGNRWWVRDAESARPPNTCGAANAGDRSMFFGASFFGSPFGAAFSDNCSGNATINTSTSPNINTIGYTNLVLQFDFIADGGTSFTNFKYSINGGSTFITPASPAFTTATPAVPGGSNLNNMKTDNSSCSPQGTWTRVTWNMPVACEGIANLQLRFIFTNLNDCGGVDPSFAVDKVKISAPLPPSPPSVWLGTTADWNTASNWSSGAVPNAGTSISIPDPTTLGVGKFMPAITTNAVVLNVCNSGTITIGNGSTNVNLTIGGFLNNYGAITTTNSNSASDIIFNGTGCVYRGAGLNHDVDYQVGTTAGQKLTLEANLSCRSLNLAFGTLDASNNTITLKKDFTRAAATTLTTTNTTNFVFDGPNVSTWVNPYSNPVNQVITTQDITTTQNISLGLNTSFPNVYVRKQNNANIVTLASAFTYTVSNLLKIESGTLDANTRTLNGGANVVMTGGQLRISKLSTTVPEITGVYTLSNGTIDLYGTGNQTIRQLPTATSSPYYNLIFQGSGTKSFVAGTTTCNNSVSIAGTATVDVSTNTFNGSASLNMAATACSLRVAKVSGAPTLPELSGTYTLNHPSVIEIQNTTAGTQTQYLRVPTSGNYANLVFSNTSAGATAMRYLTGNTTVNNSVVITNASGANNVVDASTYTFNGSASLTMSNFSNLRLAKTGVALPEFTGTITYNDGSNVLNSPGVEFYGASAQTFKTNAGYRNMLFSNTGTKTMQSGISTATRSVNITDGLVVVAGGTDQFNGVAELRMAGGELQIATLQSTAAIIPEFTGTYTLNAGKVTLNGIGNQALRSSVSSPSANYIELNFAGSGIKSLTGNTNVFGRLFLNLPTSAGNYVDGLSSGSLMNVSNASLSSVYRSGGHVVGDLRRSVLTSGFPLRYFYPVGSDGLSGTVTYYEPLQLTLNAVLTGTTSVTSNFSKSAPTAFWTPPLVELGINYTALETEGFWSLNPSPAPSGAIDYGVEVTPSSGWVYTYSNKALAKRSPSGISPTDEWNWHGSNRLSEFNRNNYNSFSEFAIVTGDNVLPVVASPLTASAKTQSIKIEWLSFSEINHKAYILERSDAPDFKQIKTLNTITAEPSNNATKTYQYDDFQVEREKMYYYRYRQIDIDGREQFSNIASAKLSNTPEIRVVVYPNPTQADLSMIVSGIDEENLHVIVFDAIGRRIHEQIIQPDKTSITIPTSQWSDGVYTFEVIGKQIVKGKFVVQK